VKLEHALDTFALDVQGCVAVDVGASAGGFTTVLLERGAARVYAADAGIGQLRGSLRRDPRVVNLEGRNLGVLDRVLVPEPVDVVTMDLSYLALHDAVPQLERLELTAGAVLVVLVKPTFELGRGVLAASDADVAQAVERAVDGVRASGWAVLETCPALRTGQRGAREVFVHAIRARTDLSGGEPG
jgi:23S rRNA (cytidine1920-2'-O)/16S rRNA (cytidine1409-2'-O)-methyltransferase